MICVCGRVLPVVQIWPLHCSCGAKHDRSLPVITYVDMRRATCEQCPSSHYLPKEDGCGSLKAAGKGYRLMGVRGIPDRKARCPEGWWDEVLTAETIT